MGACTSQPVASKRARISDNFSTTARGPTIQTTSIRTNIAAIRSFLRACTAQPLERDEWVTALCWNMVVPPEVRGALIAREIDGDDALSSLSVPVLVSHGRDDAIVLPSMAEHVLSACEPAVASWYDDVGHVPFLERPKRFNDELAALTRRSRN